jgi:small subunit ribosomal protein S9
MSAENEDTTGKPQPAESGDEHREPEAELAEEPTPTGEGAPIADEAAAEIPDRDETGGESPQEPQAGEPDSPAPELPGAGDPEESSPAADQPAAEEPAAEEAPAGPPSAEPMAEEQPAAPSPLVLAADARYSATGKRKSSVARVILRPGNGGFEINGRSLDNYFPRVTLRSVVRQPLEVAGYLDRIDVKAKIHGGGVSSQADALRHGISKALIEADPILRGELKRRGLLTRDPRVKERKKAGLKKARKRPQFSKR